jgi:hypothetical protein
MVSLIACLSLLDSDGGGWAKDRFATGFPGCCHPTEGWHESPSKAIGDLL